MSNKLPKNIIIPALFGLFLYVFLFMGENANIFSNNTTISWIAMIIGAIILYGIVLGAVNNLTNLDLGYAGFKLSSIFFGLVIPISIFSYNYFEGESKIPYSSLLEKEGVTLISNNKECAKIKYGMFTNGSDTIIRFLENNKNYELKKSFGIETQLRIKWLDSCSYVKIKNNNSVYKHVRLGNFKNNLHYMYTKPVAYHSINNESYEMIIKIK